MYDPSLGRFLTTDPVYDPANMGNPYTYVANNPYAAVDPMGDYLESLWDVASLGLGTASLGYNLYEGNYVSALVDAGGVALDSAAVVLPIVPGGAGVALKTYRAADIAINTGQATASGIDATIAVSQGEYTDAAWGAAGAGLQGAHAGVRGVQAFRNDVTIPVRSTPAPNTAGGKYSSASRLPRDIAAKPDAPDPLELDRPISRNPAQNELAQELINDARTSGATDIRVDQQQVNRQGQRVGINRPDIQYTTPDGKQRVYIEIEDARSPRFPQHEQRILANDPEGIVIPFRVRR